VEIPSHVAGVVLSLDAAVGQVVAVGTEIIHIDVLVESTSVDHGRLKSAPQSPAIQPVAASDSVVGSTSVDHGGLKPALQTSQSVRSGCVS